MVRTVSLLFLSSFGHVDVVYGGSWYRENSFTSSATKFAINGRGDTTVIGGVPSAEKVLVYNQNEISTFTSQLTLRQTINSFGYGPTLVDNFGRDVALEGDDITGNILIIGANGVGSYKKYNGAVYYYTGDNSQWSYQQTILVDEMMNEAWSHYGEALDVDTYTDRRLVIGCANCSSNSNFIHDGSIFVFEPISSPHVIEWTQQQKLTSNSLYAIGGVDVDIYRDTLLGVGYTYQPPRILNSMKGIIFQRDVATNQWSEVQILTPKESTISDIDLYDDTMLIGSPYYRYWSTNNAGAVLVFYPNTPPYSPDEFLQTSRGLGPKPKVQWSQQQSLYSPNAMVNGYYGSTVKVWGNVMAVTEPGSGKVYVLERETRYGMWSQQIAITAAVSTSLTVEVKGSDVVVGDGTNAYVYTNNHIFNCLHISLEDQFGDGWGDAKLLVESTKFGVESFAPGCDRENPLGIRFCAIDTLDNGHYKFRIVDYEKTEFHWEILWRVYDERTGEWHIGNWLTEMEFDWSYHEEGFHNKRVIRPLPSNVTCEVCPSKPTTRRSLKSGTLAPTVSPAPTLAITGTVNWKYLTLQDTANKPWFNSYHHGTSYYISDVHGRRLLKVGTLCATTTLLPHDCWIDLPGGDYILRIGGALDPYTATHVWRFCSVTASLPPETHLEFTITDDQSRCLITSFYTRSNYCKHVADYDVILKMYFYYSHSSTDIAVSLTSSDQDILKGVITTLLTPYTVNSVDITSLSSYHFVAHVALHWGVNIFQSEEIYHEQIGILRNSIQLLLAGSMTQFATYLTTMSPKNSLLHHMEDIYLEEVEYEGITGGVLDEQEVVSNEGTYDQHQKDYLSDEEDENLKVNNLWKEWNIIAWSGWILFVVGVVGVTAVGIWRKITVNASVAGNAEKVMISCVSDVEQQKYSPLDTSLSEREPLQRKTVKKKESAHSSGAQSQSEDEVSCSHDETSGGKKRRKKTKVKSMER